MALGVSSALNINDLSGDFLGCTGRMARKSNSHTSIHVPTDFAQWDPRRLASLWNSTGSYSDGQPFTSTVVYLGAYY
jgi:hypothetical protein